MLGMLSVILSVWLAAGPRGATTAVFAIEGPTGTTLASGSPITVAVRSTYTERIAACAYDLSASGGAMRVTQRDVATPLRYLATIPSDPYGAHLPSTVAHGASLAEVFLHINSNGISGDANDGLAPGTDVEIAVYTIEAIGIGSWTLTLDSPRAAETQSDADGALFDNVSVEPTASSLTLLLTGGPDINGDARVDLRDYAIVQRCAGQNATGECMGADVDADGDIDIGDSQWIQTCLSGPAAEPSCGGA